MEKQFTFDLKDQNSNDFNAFNLENQFKNFSYHDDIPS